MKQQTNRFRQQSLAALLALAVSQAALAQRVLEEVVVTAQKKEQGLIDVPASVSVIGGEMVSEAALIDAQDIVQYTPNVKLDTSNSNPALSIRGFGSPPLARSIEPSVGIVINDIYYGRTTFVNDGAFDMERLEVLRGPQGTLFGKNTVSGVLNFTTRAPDTELGGFVNVAGGTLNERRAEGGVSFPVIGDRVGGRFAFRVRDREFGNYNTTLERENEQEDQAFRLRLGWDITDDSVLGIEYFQADSEGNAYNIQLQEATDRALAEYRTHDPRTEDDVYDGNQAINEDESNERNSKSLAITFETFWEGLGPFNNLGMKLLANRAEIETPFSVDTDFSPIDFSFLSTNGPELFEQTSTELRFSGDTAAPFGWGVGLDFVAGLFFYKSEGGATQNATNNLNALQDVTESGQGGLPPGSEAAAAAALIAAERSGSGDPNRETINTINIVALENESQSIFMQGTWFLSDTMDITLGLRYGEEDKKGVSSSTTNSVIVAQRIGGQEDFFENYDNTEYEFSPKLAFSWEVFDDVRLFALIAEGSKSGGLSGPLISPIDVTYETEESTSIEFGIKSFLFDKTLQLNFTAYQVEYKNLQVQAFNGIQFTTVNAGEATGKGFEMDFQWLPDWQALTVAGSFGISDGTYDSYPCAPGTALQSVDDNPAGCGDEIPRQDLSGREVAYNPEISASLYPTLRFPLGDDWGVMIGLDILYQGEYYLDLDLDERAKQDPTTKVNFRVGVKQMDGGFSAVLNVKNITKEEQRQLFLDSPRNPGNYVALPLPVDPQVTLDLRYTFGEG